MYNKKSEKGQALVIIALAAVGLVAFTALAIDGGMVLSDRRHAQNAADTAAFAAALAKIRTPDYAPSSPALQKQAAIDAGEARAESNGYDDNGTTNTVEVNIPPISGPYAGNDEYIQVIITSHVRMMFARIVGRQYVTNRAEAVTRAQSGSSDTSSGLPAIAALQQTGTAISMNGNINLDVINSGVFSNSSSSCSIVGDGIGEWYVDTDYTIADGGTACMDVTMDLNGAPVVPGTQIPYPPAFINPPPPSITCSGTGSVSGNTVNPGTFTSELVINGTGDYTFTPGSYCFDNGVKFDGNFNITANDVNFRINGGTFTLNGNNTFTCNNMLVYSAGGNGMEFNGTGTNNCSNTTFYMATGKVVFGGDINNTLTAPTSGVYKGLLIYLPYTNTTELTINGNSEQHLTGSVIAVGSQITINGNGTAFAVNTQFVGLRINVNGNVNWTINYDPAQQYLPPEGPAIELIE